MFVCLYATSAFAWKYTVNNQTNGDIRVVFDAVSRPSDYYLQVGRAGTTDSKKVLDTGAYCIRGVTVIGLGGALQGKQSEFKSISGDKCWDRTITVKPIVRMLENPILGTSQEVVADFDVNI